MGVAGDVLVVDDDEVIRGLLAWLFEQAGYSVRQAADGSEALAALEGRPPDCMILDLMMPRVDGQSVLQQRQEGDLAPNTRVIVLTAKTDRMSQVWCWERGADEYLIKPFDGERLLRLVGDLMSMSHEQLEHRRQAGLEEARRLDAIEAAFGGGPDGRHHS
ncbi:MAG TPA: response regulator [Acidimicrobiales bacterium]|nr:response regulator [Acidimicrobiales bacterium]